MTIGSLAAWFGLGTHVLRHWESMGVLTPATRVNGRRLYAYDQMARVAIILRAKAGGLSLELVRQLLHTTTRAERRDLLAEHCADLERRIAELEASKEMVEHCLHCPTDDFMQCREFQRQIRSTIEQRGVVALDHGAGR